MDNEEKYKVPVWPMRSAFERVQEPARVVRTHLVSERSKLAGIASVSKDYVVVRVK